MRLPAFMVGLALLAVATTARADEDAVFLKNGKKLTGKVVDEDAKKGVTIELKDGKKRTFKPKEVERVEKARPTEPAKAAEPPAPPKPKVEEPEADDEPPPPAPPGDHVRRGVSFGAGVGFALVRSKSLGPQLGLSGVIDIGTGSPFYVRVEPGLSYFTRSTSVNALRSIDFADPASPEVNREKITNNVRLIELHAKAGLGYDIGESLTARLHGIVGYSTATTDAPQCVGGANAGLLYGGGLVPLAVRALGKKQLELGANVDYVFVPVPKCDIPVSGSIVAPAPTAEDPRPSSLVSFPPALKKQRVGALFFGLHLSYVFR